MKMISWMIVTTLVVSGCYFEEDQPSGPQGLAGQTLSSRTGSDSEKASEDPPLQFDTAIVADLIGVPVGKAVDTEVKVYVHGLGITQYLYKYGQLEVLDCGNESGYIIQRDGEEPITMELGKYQGKRVSLCVIGGTGSHIWQPYSRASKAIWYQSDLTEI